MLRGNKARQSYILSPAPSHPDLRYLHIPLNENEKNDKMPSALEKRIGDAMETIANAMEQISETTKAIESSQRLLNDNFLLHQTQNKSDHVALKLCAEGVKEEVHGLREDFKTTVYPIFKWMAVAIIVIAGGAEALKFLGVL